MRLVGWVVLVSLMGWASAPVWGENPPWCAMWGLRPESPAIDAGTDVGLPYHGLAPDMGACESSGTPPESNTPPIVDILEPSAGSVVSRGSDVIMRVGAVDDEDVIVEVVMSVNAVELCRVVDIPYACVWHVPSGKRKTYDLTATARDGRWAIGAAPVVTVTSR